MYFSKWISQNVFPKCFSKCISQNVSQPDRRGLMLRPDGPLAFSKHLAPDCWFTVCPTMLSWNCTVIYSLIFKSARYGIPAVYYQNGIVGYGGLAASRWFIAKMVSPPLTPILGHGHPLHPPGRDRDYRDTWRVLLCFSFMCIVHIICKPVEIVQSG